MANYPASKAMPTTKGKTRSKSSPKFTDPGPSGRMSGKNSAGPQIAGQSASMGRGGGKNAKGGSSGRMATKQTVKNATSA